MASYTKQAKKHTGRAQKEQIVAELVEKLDNSSALVFADYQGLTHKQLEDLRKELKKLDSTIVVTKNSLIKISLGKSKNFGEFKDNEGLDRPTAALFIQDDYTQPLKELAKAIKNFGLPKIKFGILEGQLLNEAGVLKIASLPNRETLLAQLAGTLNSPIQGLVVTLNANLQKFVMVLNAIAASNAAAAQNKPAATPAPAQPTEQPAVEATPTLPDQTTTQAGQSAPANDSADAAVSASEPAYQPDAPIETDEAPAEPTEVREEQTTEEDSNSNEKSEEKESAASN